MSAQRPRIPLNPTQTGLNSAFSALEIQGLPPGPSAPAPNEPTVAKPKPGRVVLRRETAGRGGKTVLVIDGFAPQHTAAHLDDLARQLRTACGCGGTVKERTIEIQGDQPAKIRATLEAAG